MTPTIIINPTSGAPAPAGGLRVVLEGLAGKTVGFFSNNKPNAAVVLGHALWHQVDVSAKAEAQSMERLPGAHVVGHPLQTLRETQLPPP